LDLLLNQIEERARARVARVRRIVMALRRAGIVGRDGQLPRVVVFRSIRRLRVRAPHARERALRDVLRQIEHLRHQVRIDALQEDAGRGAITVRDHHRIDDEGRDADDVRYLLHLLHHVAVLAKIDRVLQHEHVRVHAEHLLAELLLEAARHAHHRRERGDAEHHADHRERGAHRDERSLLGAQISEREQERIVHGRERNGLLAHIFPKKRRLTPIARDRENKPRRARSEKQARARSNARTSTYEYPWKAGVPHFQNDDFTLPC
jgi:hypothetical protein